MSATNNQAMIKEQIIARKITNKNVIEAMSSVDRELFVDQAWRHSSYTDFPLPIASGQTISQPYIVAFMTDAARLDKEAKILEIGTGSGYQTAILAKICKEVYTIERVQELAEGAKNRLKELGYNNVHFKAGDGYKGWSSKAPFDAIIVTAAPEEMPQELIKQLKMGGRLIVPIGYSGGQELTRLTKTPEGTKKDKLMAVRFVPMVKNNNSNEGKL